MAGVTFHRRSSLAGKCKNFFLLMREFKYLFFFFLWKGQRERRGANEGELLDQFYLNLFQVQRCARQKSGD